MSELVQTLAQVLPCEFWEAFEKTFLDRTPPISAFVLIFSKLLGIS